MADFLAVLSVFISAFKELLRRLRGSREKFAIVLFRRPFQFPFQRRGDSLEADDWAVRIPPRNGYS
jgi:hypothetical protein